MEVVNPVGQPCLTAEERNELQTAWAAMQGPMQQMGAMVAQAEDVDCDALLAMFRELADTFDAVERLVIRPKQVRLMHVTHGGAMP